MYILTVTESSQMRGMSTLQHCLCWLPQTATSLPAHANISKFFRWTLFAHTNWNRTFDWAKYDNQELPARDLYRSDMLAWCAMLNYCLRRTVTINFIRQKSQKQAPSMHSWCFGHPYWMKQQTHRCNLSLKTSWSCATYSTVGNCHLEPSAGRDCHDTTQHQHAYVCKAAAELHWTVLATTEFQMLIACYDVCPMMLKCTVDCYAACVHAFVSLADLVSGCICRMVLVSSCQLQHILLSAVLHCGQVSQ